MKQWMGRKNAAGVSVAVAALGFGGLAGGVLLGGCGGGGGGGGNTNPTRGTLRLQVAWPDRTRALPTAADSLRIVTESLGEGGTQIDNRVINRTQNTAYTQEVTLTDVPLQRYRATMTAFQGANGTGTNLGSGNTEVELSTENPSPTVSLSANIVSKINRLQVTGGKVGNPINVPIPLTVTALDTSGAVVPTLPVQFSWLSSNPAGATVNNQGQVTGSIVAGITVTVTDRDSGKTGTRDLQLGCPLVLDVRMAGTGNELPFRVNEPDDSLNTVRTVKTGGGAFFFYIGNPAANTFTAVTLNGNQVTLTAPATYGDAVFSGWTQNGAPFAASASVTVDPTEVNSLALTANYTARTAGPNGYTPNYLNENDIASVPPQPNRVVNWGTAIPKVTFMTEDNYTPERRAAAVEGLDWWKRATAGKITYQQLPDNDFANADIIVCLTSNPASPASRPDRFQVGLSPANVGNLAGLTYFLVTDGTGGSLDGFGKRVIHLYRTETAAIRAGAAHEFAHALGFNGHSESADDLMHPIGDEAFPSGRDVNTMLTIWETGRKAPTRRQSSPAKPTAIAIP
ncbi:MAG: hypothetical protein OHK0029_40840 [Armatimonadaceae bacterium]